MNNGKLAPQKAWDDKLINVDDLLWIFTSYIEPWGGFPGKKNVEVRRAMAKLLIENGGEKLKDTAKLPPTVRLWLADYYQGLGDEKCLALCESILGEIKTPVKGENALVFQTLERIGWYFRDKGEPEKAAEAWLRMANYHADTGWWTPDALLEAGNAYLTANQSDKARALFAQIPAFGRAWYSGMALWAQANALIARGQHAEARRLLNQPLPSEAKYLEVKSGEAHAVPDADAGKVRVALLALLAWSHYKAGEWQQVREVADRTIALQRALPGAPQDKGLGAQITWLKSLSEWSERWAKSPLWCQPEGVREKVASPGLQPITLRLSVQLQNAEPLQITSNNPLVRIKPVPVSVPAGASSSKALFARQDYYLEIAPHDYAQPLEAQITVSCDKWPAATRLVPLRVEAAF